jgi:UrcA family protein
LHCYSANENINALPWIKAGKDPNRRKIMPIAHKFLGAAVSILSLTCAAAHADSTANADTTLLMGPHAQVVRFHDLNLEQPRDLARLFNRVSAAADGVCGPRSFAGLYNKTADYESCYSDAVARAVAHIDRPSVTQYFQQRTASVATRRILAQQ